MALQLVCAAIIGRENEPIYIRSFEDENAHDMHADSDGLKWQFYLFQSLDVVEQRCSKKDAASGSTDPYLGLLCPVDEYRVYVIITYL
jgi:hypothetical protein